MQRFHKGDLSTLPLSTGYNFSRISDEAVEAQGGYLIQGLTANKWGSITEPNSSDPLFHPPPPISLRHASNTLEHSSDPFQLNG